MKRKITRIVFEAGTTVTLPAPVGSRSSLDIHMHNVDITQSACGNWFDIKAPGFTKMIHVPLSKVSFWDSEGTVEETQEKRGPGRPKASDVAAH